MTMSAAAFVSDLHLCPTRPAATRTFLAFLEALPKQADTLYILGDLFDYWAGDDDLGEPFNASVAAAMARLAQQGTQIVLLAGNRDFLLGPGFAGASAATVVSEPYLATVCGKPTLMLHGDSLCTNDQTYQDFCREVRSTAWREAFLARPLAERHSEIETMRARSEEQKRAKPAAIMDVANDAVDAMLRQYGYPRLVHGHTHRSGRHEHVVDGHSCERWVLGEWYEAGNYLLCDASQCRLLPWPPQGK